MILMLFLVLNDIGNRNYGKKINIKLQSIETKGGYQWGKMWVTGQKMMKNQIRGTKRPKKKKFTQNG